jgi:hypothetical protein
MAMNISFNAQSPYSSLYQRGPLLGQNSQQRTSGSNSPIIPGKKDDANSLSKFTNKITEEKPSINQQMRKMIRGLEQERYAASANNAVKDKLNDFSKLSGAPDADEEEIDTSENYNYKTVATKIQQAKTSISAGQAVLAAKRETLKLKRKIASGAGDAEELQLALTHAKRMEMVARKKKHHLELEELVENTQKADERAENLKDPTVQMQSTIVSAEEEKLTEKEDEIFDERQEMLEAALEQLEESGISLSEEEMKELNEMISEFGEEELKELEEAMEMLESMEIVDPHMGKEELEELKRKHRASEQKAMVKADMDYLKGMLKHQMEKEVGIPSLGTLQGMGSISASAISEAGTMGSTSIDVQV